MPAAARIGIDLGGTKVLGVVVGDDGEVRAKAKRKTPTTGGPAGVVEAIVGVVDELGGADSAVSVGVGAPGVVDVRTGTVSRAPNLPGWDRAFALGPALAEALGVPVTVENDVNAATLAEQLTGAAAGARDALCVYVGTGVGGGLVLDGRLRRGATGAAGEIGHTIVQPGGRRCGCGGEGHLEAYAGRSGLEAEARRRAAEGSDTVLLSLAGDARMTSKVWARALAAGDAVAAELLDEAVAALGVALANVAALVDLDLVVLGGGLAGRLGPSFVGRVEQATRARLFAPGSALRVVPAALEDLGGAIGAALAAREKESAALAAREEDGAALAAREKESAALAAREEESPASAAGRR